MRDTIFKLGQTKLVLAITVIAIFLAVTFDAMIAEILQHNINPKEDYLRVAIIALLIAPSISWYLVGLLFELYKLEKN